MVKVSRIDNYVLLKTNCEVHTEKYLDRSFKVRTEWNEVHTKNQGLKFSVWNERLLNKSFIE